MTSRIIIFENNPNAAEIIVTCFLIIIIIIAITTGVIHLSGPIGKVPKDLVHLNLAQCGLTSKGVNYLASAFNSNNSMSTTLTYLNLSGNNLKDEINVIFNNYAICLRNC